MAVPEADNPETLRLREWYLALIKQFREAVEVEDSKVREGIPANYNFLSPFQVEVFWFRNPEFQILIYSNFSQRPDLAIHVWGPVPAALANVVIANALKQDRWMGQFDGTISWGPFGQQKRPTQQVKEDFFNFFAGAVGQGTMQAAISTGGPRFAWGQVLPSGSFAWVYLGNIADSDPSIIIRQILDGAKGRPQTSKPSPAVAESPAQVPPVLNVALAFFFPPIAVGEIPRPASYTEFASKSYLSGYGQTVFDGKLGEHRVTIRRDGLVTLACENREEARGLLNLLFGVARLHGVPMQALRESELGKGRVTPDSFEFRGVEYRLVSDRTRLFQDFPPFHVSQPHDRIAVSTELLSRLVDQTNGLAPDTDTADDVRLLLEASTYLDGSQPAQSFILSWLVIERFLARKWEEFLRKYPPGAPHKGEAEADELDWWDADAILRAMRFSGELDHARYGMLMALKKKRNGFIHENRVIGSRDAARAFQLALELLKPVLPVLTDS